MSALWNRIPLTPAEAHIMLTNTAVKLAAQAADLQRGNSPMQYERARRKLAAADQLHRIADDVSRLAYIDRETADCVAVLAAMGDLGGTAARPSHTMQDPRETTAFERLIGTGEVEVIHTHQADFYTLTAFSSAR